MPQDITSPFTPGRPVPVEFFVGRLDEIKRLRGRVRDALTGRLELVFLHGERGIGKSSLASFVRHLCERELRVLGVHTFLGGVTTLEEMVRRIFDRLLKDSIDTRWYEKVSKFFGDSIREVGLFGVSVGFEASDDKLRRLTQDFSSALRNLLEKVSDDKKGLLLILDDLNGLATSAQFANWLKSLVDEVSTSQAPLPLCILIVGLENVRKSLIDLNPSLARYFDPIEIRAWSPDETSEFFGTAFEGVGVRLEAQAREILTTYAGGLPVLAHELGDAAFAAATDNSIDYDDAIRAIVNAAEVVGRKHLEPQVYQSIRSKRYRKILRKIAFGPGLVGFTRAEALQRLTKTEIAVLDNFLKRMVDLGALIKDTEEGRGAYRFSSQLYSVYFWLEGERATGGRD